MKKELLGAGDVAGLYRAEPLRMRLIKSMDHLLIRTIPQRTDEY